MRKRLVVLSLLMLLSSGLLTSCDLPQSASASDPPSPIIVTPADTSARTLYGSVIITEDQDAVDNRSDISVQFSTTVIDDLNFALFDDQEKVTCNDQDLNLSSVQPPFNLKVVTPSFTPGSVYHCSYTGNNGVKQLDPVDMFSIPQRTRLLPQLPTINSQNYTVSYIADGNGTNTICHMTAVAIGNNGGVSINGNTLQGEAGTYSSPLDSSLTGRGDIVINRTCKWIANGPFNALSITYISQASVEVTWSH